MERIGSTVRGVENRHRPPPDVRTHGPRGSDEGMWFRTTASFAAATDDGTTLTMPVSTAKPLAVTLGTTSDTAKASGQPDFNIANGLNATIASGKIVHATPTAGRYVIDLVWCSS